MILVFGGTTEGLKAITELEDAGSPYYYSTRGDEQQADMHHGTRLCGAMDDRQIEVFCKEKGIRLIVDAAHPFASQLHNNIATAAEHLAIPVIRFERRNYVDSVKTAPITFCDDYADAVEALRGFYCVLATTGVQSIGRLKPLRGYGVKVYHRILRRQSSLDMAKREGVPDDELCFYGEETTADLIARLGADAILMKDSGESGGTEGKINDALKAGVRIFVIRRPAMPQVFVTVNGEHGLRRAIEKLLPEFYPLHSGLTTGTIATAASVAAVLRLHHQMPSAVPVVLPNGETIHVDVGYGDGYAYSIKDSGDDPDVTDGIEIRARATLKSSDLEAAVEIVGGEGIGTFTLPGFDYSPGEAAINKVPRQMIAENVSKIATDSLQSSTSSRPSIEITLSVVNGEEIARRTFNPRLGIVGGISIVGVSGIVKPFSEDSFKASIRKCIEVAVASGTERVVIYSGAKSEGYVRTLYPTLPDQCFIEYGNYIGDTLKMISECKGDANVSLCVMIGKAVKLAAGALDTHSKRSTMDKVFIANMVEEAMGTAAANDLTESKLSKMTLARELWNIIPANDLDAFTSVVIRHCHEHCDALLPGGTLDILLVREDGKVFGLPAKTRVQA